MLGSTDGSVGGAYLTPNLGPEPSFVIFGFGTAAGRPVRDGMTGSFDALATRRGMRSSTGRPHRAVV